MKIIKHGKTYNETEKYPFCLCPECMSEKTEIVTQSVDGYHTGEYHYSVHGLYERKLIYVNHKCNECGCIFRDEYEESKKPREISECTMFFIVGILIFALSIFFFFCVLEIDDPSWSDYLILVASIIGILVGSFLVPVSLLY